jgi:type I restriction enzyme, S subunit
MSPEALSVAAAGADISVRLEPQQSDLPAGWALAQLGEIVTQRNEKVRPDRYSALPFIGMDDVPPGSLRATSHGWFRDMKSAANAVGPGEILYGRLRPYLNKVALAEASAAVSGEFIVLQPRAGIEARYTQFALHSREFVNFAARGTSGERPRIDFDKISKFNVPIPPVAEQRRIVARIDELLAEIDEGEAALERARHGLDIWRRALLKAAVTGELTSDWREANRPAETGPDLLARIRAERGSPTHGSARRRPLQRMPFDTISLPSLPKGWIWSSLGDLFEINTGSTPSRAEPSYWGGTIPWVSSGEVAFCRIKKTRECITSLPLRGSSNRIHPPGTVLLAMIGEGKTRGQCAILDVAACNNQNSAAIRVGSTPIEPQYIYYVLQERYYRSRKESQGGNQPALNGQKVASMAIPLPSLEEINEIVSRLDYFLTLGEAAEHEYIEANTAQSKLRQSILKSAFDGRLVPQDPTDEPASVLLARLRNNFSSNGARRRRPRLAADSFDPSLPVQTQPLDPRVEPAGDE